YGNFKTGAPFHKRLADHSATQIRADKEQRQELRLLYVGWTRARDKVVLAGRAGFLGKGILRLLVDNKGKHLLNSPHKQEADWAGRKVDILTRTAGPAAPRVKKIQPGIGYKPGKIKDYPSAFQAASSLLSVAQAGVFAGKTIAKRIALSGTPDMQALGEAVHTFLGADDYQKEKAQRLVMVDAILQRWQVAHNLAPEALLAASNRLNVWVTAKWPHAIWMREYPVALQQDNGTIISGVIDLLLEVPAGYVIIDHKSFPGNNKAATEKAVTFTGQLGGYAEAVAVATGKNVVGCFIHLPVSGMVVDMTGACLKKNA
ncbi:MAG: PD-(D/E)XK nuclease family protein, partial [Pseudomonadota bacterium]|nr:PD-(D/E)XK nuclease family protein [Pseudomonadota bacterium]